MPERPDRVDLVEQFDGELVLVALTGWQDLPADRVHHLVGLATGAGRLDDLVRQPGLLTHVGPPALLTALFQAGDHARAWAHLLTAAGLPDPGSVEDDQADRLRIAAAGIPGLPPSVRAAVDGTAGVRPREGWAPLWSTAPAAASVALRTTAGRLAFPADAHAVVAVPTRDGPDLLALAVWDEAQLWDPTTGQPVGGPFGGGHSEFGHALAVVPLPDGRTVLAVEGRDAVVQLWDPATGTTVGEPLRGHSDRIRALTAVPLPDGRTLLASGGDDATVLLWDPAGDPPEGQRVGGHTMTVNLVAAVPAPGGATLLATCASDSRVRLWDPTTRRPTGRPLIGHTGRVTALTPVPADGGCTVATGGADGTVRLWDLATRQPVGAPLTGHTGRVTALTTLPAPGGCTVVSGGDDATVRLWDPATGRQSGAPLTGHTAAVNALARVPVPGGHLLASAGADRTVRLWDVPSAGSARGVVTGPPGRVGALAAVPMPDGRVLLASGGDDATVRLRDARTGRTVGPPLTGHTRGVRAVAAVPTSDRSVLLATGGDDGTVRRWDPATGRPVGEVLRWPAPVLVVAVTPRGGPALLAVADGTGTVRLCDPATGAVVGVPWHETPSTVSALALVPATGGRVLLAVARSEGEGVADEVVRLWDPVDGRALGGPLTGHDWPVTSMATVPLPDGRRLLASASQVRTVQVRDPWTGGPLEHLHHPDVVTVVTSPADGSGLLVTGCADARLRVWDLVTGTQVRQVALPGPVHALCPLPGGLVAVGYGDQVAVLGQLWPAPADEGGFSPPESTTGAAGR